jgi:hypothetical protein
MLITIINITTQTEEVAIDMQADEFLEIVEYDSEWENVLNEIESNQLKQIYFQHSDGQKYIIIKENDDLELNL